MKRIVLISFTAIILIVTFFSGIFIPKRAFVVSVNFAKQYLRTDFYQENVLLKLQNENLKAQLQRVQDVPDGGVIFDEHRSDRIAANVFSTYPFNMKDTISVDRGSSDGVANAMVATVADSILLGQVTGVREHSSVVRTIFDSHWQLPVRIGPDNINGLFEGGNDPKVVLVEKQIKVGDGVFSAAKEFPMGIKIGEIKEIKEEAGGIFKEATIRTPYSIGEVRAIFLEQ
ncbi:MAG: Cell shape-determining protein MreC [Candidatus Wolfebacteria bacterium GW2011_GWC2_46_275]|uniref:Cell shape-determining protein MreC n=2 Tax=Candidatus Wolfeibacteriota TaxID=1752735 RepID=A0A0G1U5U0_9BACT|nr:MAG: Cell shape-determining protein MreC [Candidatus Wolfebacteria bacterium GW2011_GWB1_47_1]KKU36533.1 MAG: Cell shape-determining protein MreC [Candidatus Wolfebacteria bacterium GW2011_GWC2_46_275]KKU42444.1 MAG: Cell shape-determining protein MreC [Candidatus Wolfebacteria bacterium GW2011_GWB2_46_69]KKU54229.1 MAG: Cell shape-determining protein MreC [Candidatus Wolfebacteria bacterium GW2011_GWC1_47_103]KKU59597.1 MAG: Cell shape-determining protein MreC [Candidatus Wolfebacteria bact